MTDRIPYGEESTVRAEGGPRLYIARDEETCHDCGVDKGELHKKGCDVEQCPECLRQLIGCDHDFLDE